MDLSAVGDVAALERELEDLRRENARLKRLLKLSDREMQPARHTATSPVNWEAGDPS